ncbi:collectin-12 [Elysia marginata]|uniref:Collectin-12 n=1 Tax=Elysia marginata TaxID=1093978 RepID=A0AAV4EE53_9GAST|nr:collectin-12 [Elysia marginata]
MMMMMMMMMTMMMMKTTMIMMMILVVFGEYCYEFVLYRDLEFDTAKDDCRSRGGDLVKIFDKATQEFLYKQLTETYGQKDEVWIGLTDKNAEDKWEWMDGSLPEYNNWAPGQPGIVHGLEDCAALDPDDGGLWHDYKCEDLFIFVDAGHRYICQYNLRSVGAHRGSPNHSFLYLSSSVFSFPKGVSELKSCSFFDVVFPAFLQPPSPSVSIYGTLYDGLGKAR